MADFMKIRRSIQDKLDTIAVLTEARAYLQEKARKADGTPKHEQAEALLGREIGALFEEVRASEAFYYREELKARGEKHTPINHAFKGMKRVHRNELTRYFAKPGATPAQRAAEGV